MRPDLLHAQASIDWARGNFPSLHERMKAWIEQNLYIGIERSAETNPNDLIAICQREPLPHSFMVEVGADIDAQMFCNLINADTKKEVLVDVALIRDDQD